MADGTARQTSEMEALERELAAARAEADGLKQELSAICVESEAALEDLRRLVQKYQEVQQDSAATLSRIAAIRASNTWRAVETLRRMRRALGLQRGRNGGLALAKPGPRRAGVPSFVRTAPLGVNVAGYLDTESGMGEAARGSIRSLEAAGIPVALNNVPSRLRTRDQSVRRRLRHRQSAPVQPRAPQRRQHGVVRGRPGPRVLSSPVYDRVLVLGARRASRRLGAFLRVRGRGVGRQRVPASGVRGSLAGAGGPYPAAHRSSGDSSARPIALRDSRTRRRLSLHVRRVESGRAQESVRRDRGLPEGRLPRGQAVLVLKFTNAEYDRDAVRRLHEEAAGLNVVMLDGYMDRTEIWALLRASDCYLSPHRSEGFGLTMLEAMCLGKPVIATAYSGNTDFMTAENSFPLPYRLVTLTRDYGPYMRGASWADPDLDEAARLMRLIVEQPEVARARGSRAERDIAQERDPSVTGAIVRQRLDAIRNVRADQRTPQSAHDAGDARARADALRQRLKDALREAQASLDSAQETNQRLHRELDEMSRSSGRRWLVAVRQSGTRAARAIRHPAWTTGTVVRGFLDTRGPATARRALAHLRRRSLPLRVSSPVRRWFAHGDESLAVRWIGPLNLRHQTLEALLCHPPAGVEYRVTVPAGSRFECACALSPQVWQDHPPRVEFTIAVQVPSADWRRDVTLSIDPGSVWTDRRWHPVSIELPPVEGAIIEAVVTLSTRVAGGASIDSAWAIFGEPRFEWKRAGAEVRRSIAIFGQRLRATGLRSTLDLLKTAGITSADADAYPRWVARHTPGDADLETLAREVAALPHQPTISVIARCTTRTRSGSAPASNQSAGRRMRSGSCASATMPRPRRRRSRCCASTSPTSASAMHYSSP